MPSSREKAAFERGLCEPQRRHRLARRSGKRARESQPHSDGPWRAKRALSRSFQVHSADAIIIEEPWADGARPRCDGIVTNVQGLALGVTGADCGILLMSDPKAGIVAAAHAGWKGALTGIVEATIVQMEKLGARRLHIAVALGPTIAGKSYEVGPEFVERFADADPKHTRFFTPSDRQAHAYFDLPGFIGMRANEANVGTFEDLALDTYADEARFFSYAA